jgi:hypothetical protein
MYTYEGAEVQLHTFLTSAGILLLKALQLRRSFGLPNEFFPFGTVFDAVHFR